MTDSRRGEPKIIANSFERIESMRGSSSDRLELRLDIDTSQVREEELRRMAELFAEHRGRPTCAST
ncbi:MAG: hypothetical protein U5K31_05310 [Balneolaceae bacterium]|nr:hypothetical protein [Balneolaceae bacterium]